MIDTKALALAEKDYIVGERRYFHSHPELGNHEVNTTKHIMAELQKMGVDEILSWDDITGCVGIIHGKYHGKTVALRADIDALPIQEADLTKSYASRNAGVMHACGHDCHTAMLLGAAKILTQHREEIHGTVKLLFQMAEEIGTESRHYVEKGALADVSAIFGMHIWATLESGTVNIDDGPRMASSDRFVIKIHGRSAHGSAPDQGKDALVPMEKQMGAEDFSVYLETIPGLFAFLGARNRDKGIDCVHHHPAFDVDEDTFPDGSAIYARFAIDCLEKLGKH